MTNTNEINQRIFHGEITPDDVAASLVASFRRGNLDAQAYGEPEHRVVQIGTTKHRRSGGATSISVHLHKTEDGVLVRLGEHEKTGAAASLGLSALMTILDVKNLIHRIDDVAQDITSLQLEDKVWEVIERTAESLGASFELSERLRRLVCAYCQTANPVGEPHCIACGAPMGPSQPKTCPHCGNVVDSHVSQCPECGNQVDS
jgi:hypothetical protein